MSYEGEPNIVSSISHQEHDWLAKSVPGGPSVEEKLRYFGSLGVEGDFAILMSERDQLHHRRVEGFIRLGPENFGDRVTPKNYAKFGLPHNDEAHDFMTKQTANKMDAAQELGPRLMLLAVAPGSHGKPGQR